MLVRDAHTNNAMEVSRPTLNYMCLRLLSIVLQADPFGDLTTELERELGKIVKQKYKTDFYILYKYPLEVRTWGVRDML